jgi:hypothetical protein
MPHLTKLEVESELIELRIAFMQATAERMRHDCWKHNIAFVSILLRDGTKRRFASYSSQATLSGYNDQLLAQLGYDYVPMVDSDIDFGINCSGQRKYHTEPKLFRWILASPGLIENVVEVVLASEIDVCTSCRRHTLEAFRRRYPDVHLDIHEFGMIPGRDQPPRYREHRRAYGFDPFEKFEWE